MQRMTTHLRRIVLLLVIGLSLPALVPMGMSAQSGDVCADAANGTYPPGYEVVFAPDQGGSGSQLLIGTGGPDTLVGGSGADILCGFGGDDVLEGGSGHDHLDASTGSNALSGGSGNDTLIGMEGDLLEYLSKPWHGG